MRWTDKIMWRTEESILIGGERAPQRRRTVSRTKSSSLRNQGRVAALGRCFFRFGDGTFSYRILQRGFTEDGRFVSCIDVSYDLHDGDVSVQNRLRHILTHRGMTLQNGENNAAVKIRSFMVCTQRCVATMYILLRYLTCMCSLHP